MSWASKSRKQIIESDEESLQDESVTRCICGEQHSNGLMVQCDQCEVWQHCECMGLEEADIPDQYFCEQCRPTDQFESYKPLSPESDIEKKQTVEVSNNTDSDVSSPLEIDYESGRLEHTVRITKRIDKKQNKRKQKTSNKTPASRITTPQPELTNHKSAFCPENSPSVKARLPNARMTFDEMSKRANQILESVYSMQLERRSRKTTFEVQSAGTTYPTSHLIPEIPCSPSSMSSASTIPLNDEEPMINIITKAEPSSFELMDLLTRDIIIFQQRFG